MPYMMVLNRGAAWLVLDSCVEYWDDNDWCTLSTAADDDEVMSSACLECL